MTTNPIITRLANVLNAQTEAALANLAALDAQFIEALAEAEESARARFHLAQCQFDINTKDRLQAFQSNLAEMAADAVGRAVSGLLDSIEGLASDLPAVKVTPEPEPVADINAAFVARSREFAAVAYPARQQAEQEQEANPEPTPEPEPVATIQDDPEYAPVALPAPVAAHAVEAQDVALLPEDDTDEDDQDDVEDSALMPDDGIPITHDLCGLCERRGAGRNVRYSPVDGLPVDGVVYYRKLGRKWEPVRFIQG